MITPIDQLRDAALSNESARIHCDDESLTYARLLARSLSCAQALLDFGIRRGDRIAFWLPNSLAYLELLYACMHVGAIAVSINTRFRRAEVESILERTRANALVAMPAFRRVPFLEILRELDPERIASLRLAILCGEAPANGRFGAGETSIGNPQFPLTKARTVRHEEMLSAPMAESAADASLPCAIFPTSGTTSKPKFALHQQGSVARHSAYVASAFGYDEGAHLLQAIPFCGIFGFSQMMATVAGRSCVTLMPLFDAVQAGALIRERRVTHLNGPDDLIKRLLDAFPDPRPFPSLRECLIASFNPTLAGLPEEAERRGIRMTNGFGMSEIFSFFSRPPPDAPLSLRKLPGGMPINPVARVRVRDEDTSAILPPGEVGSLEVFSDTLFCEYYGDPAATRAAFTDDGYFITGDLASVQSDGSFLFKGRKGDFLRLGGFLVDPAEIERILQQAAGVQTVVVVEVSTARGNKAVAFVRTAGDAPLDTDALYMLARTELADFKVPTLFVQVSEFPVAMSPNGEKIQRAKLKLRAVEALATAR